MKNLFAITLISFLVGISFTGSAFAHEGGHPAPSPSAPGTSDSICSPEDPDVCAHVHFLSPVNTSQEASLIFHVENEPGLEVKDLKLDVWMDMGNGHGHSSAPVDFVVDSFNHYKVTNIWFVMPGQWFVRSSFTLGGNSFQINIPVLVQE